MKPYSELTPEEIENIPNGCGIGKLVVNSIFKEACNKHDYKYYFYRTWDKKILADLVFLFDMLKLIMKTVGNTLIKLVVFLFHLLTAIIYFTLVMTFGWIWFYLRNFIPKD